MVTPIDDHALTSRIQNKERLGQIAGPFYVAELLYGGMPAREITTLHSRPEFVASGLDPCVESKSPSIVGEGSVARPDVGNSPQSRFQQDRHEHPFPTRLRGNTWCRRRSIGDRLHGLSETWKAAITFPDEFTYAADRDSQG